jgi:hypothetical protein
MLATSERGQFSRSVDVFSFEVKNRAGAKIDAVYDAHAHGRFVHYPYLVCPRSRLFPERTEEIRQACRDEDVGLILFDLVVDDEGDFSIERLEVKHKAQRRPIEQRVVENHLANRFSAENAATLRMMVSGVV